MALTLEELRELKDKKGYTIASLSEYSGVPLGTLQKILNGETKNPRRATMDAIEKVLCAKEIEYSGKSFYYAQRSQKNLMVRELGSKYGIDGSGAFSGGLDITFLMAELREKGYVQCPYGAFAVEDYHNLPDDIRVELINGVFYDMSIPSNLHQEILMAVSASLFYQIKQKKGKCKVFTAPTDVKICEDNKNVVQPDIFIVCDRDKVNLNTIEGAPDFVLEILSPSTKKKDMTVKLALYLEAGVKEYWIVDPIAKKVLIYNLKEDDMIPQILLLSEKMGLEIYDGRLEIDLGEVGDIVEEYNIMKNE